MLVFLGVLLASTPADACGGFFCSSGTTTTTTTTTGTIQGEAPVTQKSERILFSVDAEGGTVTTYVEVAYVQNEEVDFAWIIPLPDVIAAEDVSTINADFFNALEMETAPSFTFSWPEVNYNTNYNSGSYSGYGYYDYDDGGSSGGCGGLGCGANDKYADDSSRAMASDGGSYDTDSTGTATATVEVAVVDEAVVGPFAIEVITALDAPEFAVWLGDNGYDMPDEALEPLTHYVDMGAAFLGVKLAPDVPEGPIDTLVFTYPSTAPMIPIRLTRIAVCPNLPIVTYILADEPWGPDNWDEAYNPGPDTRPDWLGAIDYADLVADEIDGYDGHAFIREFAMPTDQFEVSPSALDDIVNSKPYLTRLRGELSPEEMIVDPYFRPTPEAEDVAGVYEIELDSAPTTYRSGSAGNTSGGGGGQGAWLVLPLLVLLRRRTARV